MTIVEGFIGKIRDVHRVYGINKDFTGASLLNGAFLNIGINLS